MFLCRYGDSWRVDTPAKLNLFLEVVGRRPDGFHDIDTLMTPISLYDTLRLRSTNESGVQLDCHWVSGLSANSSIDPSTLTLPEPHDNLVHRAVTLLQREAGVSQGAEIKLTKRIPAAAGLGGASADAAAALLAANRAWQLDWSHEQLAELSANLGSDIPFFFYNSAAVCRGRGELIDVLPSFPRLAIVVVKPPVGLSTPDVYRGCKVTARPKTSDEMRVSASRQNVAAIATQMKNDLEPPARAMSPWIERIGNAFEQLDVLGHQMSGSGSSYFGICRSTSQSKRLARVLRSRRFGRVMQVTTCCSNLTA